MVRPDSLAPSPSPSPSLPVCRLFRGFLPVAVAGISVSTAVAANYGETRSIGAEAQIQSDPPQIALSWPQRSDLGSYTVKRIDTAGVATTSTLPSDSTGYTDTSVSSGIAYEYQISALLAGGSIKANAIVAAAIDLPLTEQRGVVLLLVDSTITTPLSPEIERLESDLNGDGWGVETHLIDPETATPPQVRSLIIARHTAAALGEVRSVFLLGKIPVPYSGNHAPDSHTTHRGAWPADAYYGDIDGSWTDSSIDNADAVRPENRNIPGDGKFDQSALPSDVDLMVGRVDLSRLPSFAPLTEIDLLRRYLDKDHAYRHAQAPTPRCAIIDDHLAHFAEGFAAPPRSALTAILGAGEVSDGDWLTSATVQPQLFGIGIGFASYSFINGVATTSQTADLNPAVTFSLLFGSYFGDWDNSDNFLRAQLATETEAAGLAAMYSGRPIWQLHALGHGHTLGHVARLTQNAANKNPYPTGYSSRRTHIGLMGDPTLRLFPVPPPSGLTASLHANGTAKLRWSPATVTPASGLLGYHVYRGASATAPFESLTSTPITSTTFSDPAPLAAGSTYLVKTITRQQTASSSYQNASQASFATLMAALTFDSWTTQHFGSAPDADIAGPDADADADDMPNLLEYALGTDPLAYDGSLRHEGTTGDDLHFTYTRNLSATDARVSVETSNDLKTWQIPATGITTSSEPLPGAQEMETVHVYLKRTAGSRRTFLRLSTTLIP